MEGAPLLPQLLSFTFCSAFLPSIVKWFIESRQKKTSAEKSLIAEIREMKTEMSQISMIDEFARHAKLQRKVNKAQDELKSIANSRALKSAAKKAIISQAVNAILGLYILYLLWMHKYDPVLILPEGWFYPFEGLLSWPTGQQGAVSVAAWLALSRISIRVFSSLRVA